MTNKPTETDEAEAAWDILCPDGRYRSIHSNPVIRDRELFKEGFAAGRKAEREENLAEMAAIKADGKFYDSFDAACDAFAERIGGKD